MRDFRRFGAMRRPVVTPSDIVAQVGKEHLHPRSDGRDAELLALLLNTRASAVRECYAAVAAALYGPGTPPAGEPTDSPAVDAIHTAHARSHVEEILAAAPGARELRVAIRPAEYVRSEGGQPHGGTGWTGGVFRVLAEGRHPVVRIETTAEGTYAVFRRCG